MGAKRSDGVCEFELEWLTDGLCDGVVVRGVGVNEGEVVCVGVDEGEVVCVCDTVLVPEGVLAWVELCVLLGVNVFVLLADGDCVVEGLRVQEAVPEDDSETTVRRRRMWLFPSVCEMQDG